LARTNLLYTKQLLFTPRRLLVSKNLKRTLLSQNNFQTHKTLNKNYNNFHLKRKENTAKKLLNAENLKRITDLKTLHSKKIENIMFKIKKVIKSYLKEKTILKKKLFETNKLKRLFFFKNKKKKKLKRFSLTIIKLGFSKKIINYDF
jgi:hypothetical protein